MSAHSRFPHLNGWRLVGMVSVVAMIVAGGAPASLAESDPPQASWYSSGAKYFSPNGDGQEDTASWYYVLSDAGAADTWVTDSDGATVRTVESQVSHPSNSTVTLSWDGRADSGGVVPDGVYTIHVSATNAGGRGNEITIQAGVDTRAPGALTTPAPGAVLSGSSVGWVFTPTSGFSVSRVHVTCGGAGSESTQADPDGVFESTLDVTGCGNGANALTGWAGWTDPFGVGHTWNFPQVAVTVANVPVLSWYFSSNDKYFSPNGDGQEDSASWYYSLSQAANVDAWVTDSGGTTVRTLESQASHSGAGVELSWDGRTGSSEPVPGETVPSVVVPDGVYTIHVSAGNEFGRSSEITTRVGVDTRAPGALTTPAAGTVVSGSSVGWVFIPTSGFSVSRVHVTCGGAGSDSTQADPDGVFGSTLDVTGCGNGANNLTGWAGWTDPFGVGHTWNFPQVAVTVANVPVLSWYYSSGNDRYFSPNGDGQEDSASWYYSLSQAANVDAWVTDSNGATVRTLESQVSHSGVVELSWDGRTDSSETVPGVVVPDGAYTVHVSASNGSDRSNEITVQAGVDTRVPGTVTTPAPNSTLIGLARFVFTPTPGFVSTTSVRFTVSTGGSATSYAPMADGTWPTSMFTGSLQNGPATITAIVYWTDPFGVSHSWSAAPVAVVIDNTTLPLTVSAAPDEGLAPLDTVFTINVSDPNGSPVSYTITYGDGTSQEGTSANPYPAVTLTHTYAAPGAYQAIVMATNNQGASAVQQVSVDAQAKPNNPPTATLTVTPTTGVAPLDVTAGIDATDADNDTLTYTLDFGDGTQRLQGTLPVEEIAHRYTGTGMFSVRLEVFDGSVSVVRYAKVTVGLSQPLAASAGDDQTVATNTPVAFDGSGSVPAAAITTYAWDFGDGATSSDMSPIHTYTQPGTYSAKLTVTSGALTATDTATITVVTPPPAQGLEITATSGGALLAGADVMVILADGSRISGTTGPDGTTLLPSVPDGSVTAYVWASGYLPTTVTVPIVDGHGDATVELSAGPAGAATLESHRMTVEEIQDAGIDVTDPENSHVYEATINLHFVPDESGPATIYVAEGQGIICKDTGCGGGLEIAPASACPGAQCFVAGGSGSAGVPYVYIPTVIYVQDQPIIQWLVIPMRASFLKEFFQVSMIVQNLTTGFTFDNGSATLTLPSGLSLAPTSTNQSLTQAVDEIPGGESRTATWVLRGDVEGSYDLSAVYSGSIEPIGQNVLLTATTQSSLQVWGASALRTTITADCKATRWGPYTITVTLKNVSDTDVYNAQVELFDRPASQPKEDAEYFFAPGTSKVQSTGVIKAGESFTARYTVYAGLGNDQVTKLRLDLAGSFIAQTGGDVDLHPVLVCQNQDGSSQTPSVDATMAQVGGVDTEHLTWDPLAQMASDVTQTLSTTLTNGDDPIDDATTVITAPAGTVLTGAPVLAGVPDACVLNADSTMATCSSGPMGPGESKQYAYSVAAPSDAATVTGYEVWTRQTLGNGEWTFLSAVPPQTGIGSDCTLTDGGKLCLDIPSTERARGRYYSVVATYSDGSKYPVYDIGTGPARYVSLGDSLSSGEGVPVFEPGTADDVDHDGGNLCHRSAQGSYGQLLVADPAVAANLTPAEFWACSGAVAADVTQENPANHEDPQDSRVSQFTDLITLSMGGSDIGFADIATICALYDCQLDITGNDAVGSAQWSDTAAQMWDANSYLIERLSTIVDADKTCADVADGVDAALCAYKTDKAIQAADEISSFASDRLSSPSYLYNGVLTARLTSMYVDLGRRAPNAQIMVMPYPRIVDTANPDQACTLGLGGLNFSGEERRAIASIIDALNSDIMAASAQANRILGGNQVSVVPPNDVDAQFAGGQLCQNGSLNPDSYVNPIVNPRLASGNQGPIAYSFQPNALGQQALEQALAPYVNSATVQVSPNQTVDLASIVVPSGAKALRVEATWPGSTVALSVTGPDDVTYDANSPGATGGGTSTSAWLDIADPAPGAWTPHVYGAVVAATGEDVYVTASVEQDATPSPVASVQRTVSETDPRTVTFDASGSTASQGTLTYLWTFSDGTTGNGPVVTHTFAEGAAMWATLELNDGVSISTWYSQIMNSTPVAADDTASVDQDTPLTVEAPGVLDNDTDADGDPLTAALDQAPAHGTVALSADGGYVYTPATGFVGTDQFTYVANDGTANSVPATVTITVTEKVVAPPKALDDEARTPAGSPVVIPVLDNDTGTGLSVAISTPPDHGSVSVGTDGTVTYTPTAGYSGSDSFIYTITDENALTATAAVAVTVLPVVVDGRNTIPSGLQRMGNVLNGAVGSGLVVTDHTSASHGLLTISDDGTYWYTPTSGFSGLDSFTFTVTDQAGNTATGKVDVTVTPVATQDIVRTDAGAEVSIPVLDNDLGTGLSVSIPFPLSPGGVTVGTDGVLTYTPEPGFSGVVTFYYQVTDELSQVGGATVTVTVVPVVDNLVASTVVGSAITGNVLDGAVGTGLTVTGHTSVSHGSLTINDDGMYSYTPVAGFSGSDSFMFTVTDQDGTAVTRTGTIVVVVGPGGETLAVATAAGAAITGNILDAVAETGLTVTDHTSPSHGSVTIGEDGSYTYTPVPGFSGSDLFTCTVRDEEGLTGTITVVVTVVPVVPAVSVSTMTDSPVSGNVLDGAVGTGLAVTSHTDPDHGSLTISEDGSYTYSPDEGFGDYDSFTFTVTDAAGTAVQGTVTISVNAIPEVGPGSVSTSAGVPVQGFLLVGAVPGSTVTSHTDPGHGTVAITPDGRFTYAPAAGFSGFDSFTFTWVDQHGETGESTVAIAVVPVLPAIDLTTPAGTALTGNVLDGAVGTGLAVTDHVDPVRGTVAIASNGTYTYVPDTGFSGLDSFLFTVADQSGQTVEGGVTVTVAPIAHTVTTSTPAGSAVSGNVLDGVVGTGLAVTGHTDPSHGSATIGSDGSYVYTPTPGFSGLDSFTFTVTDQEGQTVTGTVIVTVVPVVVDTTQSTMSGSSTTSNVLDGAVGTGLALTGHTDPGHGSVVISADGLYSYTPAAGFSGLDSFTFTVTDQAGNTATGTVTVSVAPTAAPDTARTNAGAEVVIPVLDNDSGTGLSVTITTQPSHGSVTVGAGGALTYAPATGFSGVDSWSYMVTDGASQTAEAAVTVTVVPVVGNFAVFTVVETEVAGNVLSGALGTGLAVTGHTGPGHGSVVIAADGSYTYTPAAGYSGPDSFTFTVTDQAGTTATGTVTLTVTTSPVVGPGTVTTSAGTSAQGDLLAGTTVGSHVTSHTDPSHGTLTIATDGSFTYTPAPGFSGFDSFAFAVADAAGPTVEGTVTITVTPVAADMSASAVAGSPATGNVLSGAVGTGLSVTGHTDPGHGTVTLAQDGSYSYVPAAGYSGPDSFTYTVRDQAGSTATGRVAVTVAPMAAPDTATTASGAAIAIQVTGNDAGTGLTVTSTTPPSHGGVAVGAGGTITYTPASGYSGLDSFTYTVTDAAGQTVTTTVTITVVPVAGEVAASTTAGTSATGNVLSAAVGTGLSVTGHTAPTHGTVTIATDGSYSYAPDAGYVGSDSFTYTVTDQAGSTATGTVTVVVSAPVVIGPGTVATGAGSEVQGDLLAGAPAGSTVTSHTDPGHGTLAIAPDGSFTYTPAPGYSGLDAFDYTAVDVGGKTMTATVAITVVPIAGEVAASTTSGTSATGNVLSAAVGTGLSVTAHTAPAHGMVTIATDGSYAYVPDAGYVGSDSFTYTVTDQAGNSATGTVTVTVASAPVIGPGTVTAPAGSQAQGDLLAGAPAGSTVASHTDPGHGTLTVAPDGTYTYAPAPGFSGDDTFTYTVEGPDGAQTTVTVTIQVPPVSSPDSAVTQPGAPVQIPVTENDNGSGLVVTSTTDPAHGTVTVNEDGTITYTPEPGFSGTDSFTYTTTDSSGRATTSTVMVTVAAESAATATVTFDPNDGSTPFSVTAIVGEALNSLPQPPVREGWAFTGWNLAEDGSGQWFTESTTVDGDITVYAQWEQVLPPPGGQIVPPEEQVAAPTGGAAQPARSGAAGLLLLSGGLAVLAVRRRFTL